MKCSQIRENVFGQSSDSTTSSPQATAPLSISSCQIINPQHLTSDSRVQNNLDNFNQAEKKESVKTLEELIAAVQSGTVDSVLVNAAKSAIKTIKQIDGIAEI